MPFLERVCKRQHNAPYVEEFGYIVSEILAENKTMLIIPDLTLHMFGLILVNYDLSNVQNSIGSLQLYRITTGHSI